MRQLADGHWVLAFSDPDRSAAAQLLVHQHTATLRAAYGRHLAPLTGEAPPAGAGGSAGEAGSSGGEREAAALGGAPA
jgi:hypothetical protein